MRLLLVDFYIVSACVAENWKMNSFIFFLSNASTAMLWISYTSWIKTVGMVYVNFLYLRRFLSDLQNFRPYEFQIECKMLKMLKKDFLQNFPEISFHW